MVKFVFGLAQYSHTPSLRVAGFEDEAPCELAQGKYGVWMTRTEGFWFCYLLPA